VKFTIVSLFPEILEPYFRSSIMGKAVDRGLVSYELVNIRDFATDRHRTCDDAPYGGGPGMVLMAEPLAGALDSVEASDKRVAYLTPSGRSFDQAYAAELSNEEDLVLICGRYEGIDQRIVDLYVHDQISIGDYVLSSGEIAALVLVDAIYRLISEVITADSLREESHVGGLLEYPHYTRPEEFRDLRVPEVLLSGHHARIDEWRKRMSMEQTARFRPDLIGEAALSDIGTPRSATDNGGEDGSDQGDRDRTGARG
jgi:tRNA (guanine37-N1)-methyltransferase